MPVKWRLPAEWEPQEAILLVWPHQHSDWASKLDRIEDTYIDLVAAISRRQTVIIVAYDTAHAKHIADLIFAHESEIEQQRCLFEIIPTNDTWVRDNGPVTLLAEDARMLLDFQFNGWGNKYDFELDNTLNNTLFFSGIFEHSHLTEEQFVLEGGNLESDGHGTLLTNRHSILCPTRNPGLSELQLTHRLQQVLHVDRILWLDIPPLPGDDTDGHIDTLARFCDEKTIAYSQCPERPELEAQLKMLRTRTDEPYRLVPLPTPFFDGKPLDTPANYCNFLIINDAVLVPTYDDKNDELALNRIAVCFPNREIIPLDSCTLVQQAGSIHCATMQVPALQT